MSDQVTIQVGDETQVWRCKLVNGEMVPHTLVSTHALGPDPLVEEVEMLLRRKEEWWARLRRKQRDGVAFNDADNDARVNMALHLDPGPVPDDGT